MRHLVVVVAVGLLSLQSHAVNSSEQPDARKMTGVSDSVAIEDSASAVPALDLDRVALTRQEICDVLVAAAEAHDIPIGFLVRLIWQESGFRTTAVSRAGAQGIAQFMPATAAEVGLSDPFNPTQALPASAKHLSDLHKQFGNHGLAAAAYNAGAKRIQDWLARRSRLPNETRMYVLSITGRQPEQWIGLRQNFANFTIPLGTQCQETANPVAAAQAAKFLPLQAQPQPQPTQQAPRPHQLQQVQQIQQPQQPQLTRQVQQAQQPRAMRVRIETTVPQLQPQPFPQPVPLGIVPFNPKEAMPLPPPQDSAKHYEIN